MAVSLFYGMTESGKTSLAKALVREGIQRSVIFDYNGNIEIPGANLITNFSKENLLKVFDRFKNKKEFALICRPSRDSSDVIVFNKIAILAVMLGRYQTQLGNTDRLIFFIDEADMICHSGYQSRELKYVVNVGRHDLVDTWLIARLPQRLHTDARSNASKAFIFKLTDDSALQNIRKSFGGKKTTDSVMKLEKYSFLVWNANGQIQIFNKDKKLLSSWS